MWELIRDERYVSDPTKSKGKHTRGTAVDVTLVDHRGNELTMPTSYDDFSERAHRFSARWTTEERTNSLKLEAVMRKQASSLLPSSGGIMTLSVGKIILHSISASKLWRATPRAL
jgi:zinc D-Ala-D-Ala dipeptidase